MIGGHFTIEKRQRKQANSLPSGIKVAKVMPFEKTTIMQPRAPSVSGVTVSMVAFQAVDPGSTPG